MKYNEIIDKIKEFELDVRFQKIEEFKHSEWFDISKKKIPIMEKFLSQLMNADDLDINHNEYLEIDESKIPSLIASKTSNSKILNSLQLNFFEKWGEKVVRHLHSKRE